MRERHRGAALNETSADEVTTPNGGGDWNENAPFAVYGLESFLKRIAGANRPKVVGVIVTKRAEIETAVSHVMESGMELPVWVWCAGPDTPGSEPVAHCSRVVFGVAAIDVARDLRRVWPSLLIAAWTGAPGTFALKLLPFVTPPFRAVLFNEAAGFFAASPLPIAAHLIWRLRESCRTKGQSAGDLASGVVGWISSFARRIGERVRDVFCLIYSLAWRAGQRIRDLVRLFGSLVWRAGQRIRDAVRLLGSLVWRAGQRIRDAVRLLGSFAWCAGECVRDGFNWTCEGLLAALDWLAVRAAPLSHLAVSRARQRPRAAVLPDEPAPDTTFRDDFVEVEIPNRRWPRRSVMAAAMRSDAAFIVFRMRGETGSAAWLIRMARETGAFAVAKQSAHAFGRGQLVHKHPYRRLQPGEVSEVFAPYSTLVALRRSTLIRLGIPTALTYGGALLLLFWKSSASGLRSLAAGHDGHVDAESVMALEDAELALRVTLFPALASLRPARPSRLQGNLAWSPSHCRFAHGTSGRRPRVLVVSPYLPFPLSHGGAVRIFNLCRSMAGKVDFILACFREAGETVCYDQLHQVFRDVFVVDGNETHSDPSVPKQVAEYRNAAMSDLIRHLCLERKVDLLQLEYTQMAEYRHDAGDVPVILVEHDVTSVLYRQLADVDRHPAVQDEYRRWLAFESAALSTSSCIWTVSGDERLVALELGAERNRALVIPNGVDLRRFRPAPKSAGPPVVLFVGSFRHLPNLLAFESLSTWIMPAVWRVRPDAQLHVIAGPGHERAARLAGKTALLVPDRRIVLDGFVADVAPAYREADVVAVPLPLSAGTNIKLLEAMACGRAIVSTPAGCRGLGLKDGVELLIAGLDQSFSEALLRLLGDDELRTRLAHEARRTVEKRFGWDAIALEALESYDELTGTASRAARQSIA